MKWQKVLNLVLHFNTFRTKTYVINVFIFCWEGMWCGAKYKHTEPVTNIDEKSSDRVPLFLSHRIRYDFDFRDAI